MTVGRAVKLFKLGAPLHPILVHFTIALFSASLFFDAAGFLLVITSLSVTGWWTLAAACVLTIFTVITGVISRMNLPIAEGEARSFLRSHMALGLIFFGILLILTIWRAAIWRAGGDVSWPYLMAAIGVAVVMSIQGYLGGELVYRYGAEVEGDFTRLNGNKSIETTAPALYGKMSPPPTDESGGVG